MKTILLLSLFANLAGSKVSSNGLYPETGFRNVQFYSPKTMGFGSQNFAVTQGIDGTVYIGNLDGIVSFDGSHWTLIPLPNQAAVRAMAVGPDGEIIVGAFEQIGVIKRNEFRKDYFQPLLNQIPETYKNFGDVQEIFTTNKTAYIHTDLVLFKYKAGELSICMDLKKAIGPIHFFLHEGALYKQLKDQVTPVEKGGRLFPFVPKGFIRYKLNNSTYLLENGQIQSQTSPDSKQGTELGAWLKDVRISDCVGWKNHFLIGTRDKGLIIIDDQMHPVEVLNDTMGVPINDIRSIFLSQDGSIWLALNSGLARVDLANPVFMFDKRLGLDGQIQCLARFNNKLYVGTSSGLFVLNPHFQDKPAISKPTRFTKLDSPGLAVWSMKSVGPSECLVATSKGIFELSESGLNLIKDTANKTIYQLLPSEKHPHFVFVGAKNGFGLLEKTGSQWVYLGPLNGTPYHVRSIIEARNGDIWFGTTYDGAWKLSSLFQSPDEISISLKFKQFGTGEMDVFQLGDEFGVTRENQAFIYNKAKDGLLPHPLLTPEIVPNNFYHIFNDRLGNAWFNSSPLTKIERKGQTLHTKVINIGDTLFSGIQDLIIDPDQSLWIADEDLLLRLEFPWKREKGESFLPQIGSVTYAHKPLPIDAQTKNTTLNYGDERIQIKFSPMRFSPGLLFQYRLDPNDHHWSEWSKTPAVEYTNLWEGSYHFKMRIKNRNSDPSEIAQFSFRIRPPWYRTVIAYFIYLIFLLFSFSIFGKWRSKRIQYQANVLKEQVHQQTKKLNKTLSQLKQAKLEVEAKNHLLRAANHSLQLMSTKDGLTGLANRRRLDQFLKEEWTRGERLHVPIACILMDIDHFKALNDYSGHLEGDACLVKLGSFLNQIKLRANDLAARYGGEEFVIILPNCDDEAAYHLAEEVRQDILRLNIPHPKSPFQVVTISMGVSAMIPTQQTAPDQLLSQADKALYLAKSQGRNCARAFSESTN